MNIDHTIYFAAHRPVEQTHNKESFLEGLGDILLKIGEVALDAIKGFVIGLGCGALAGGAISLILTVKIGIVVLAGVAILACTGATISVPPAALSVALIGYGVLIGGGAVAGGIYGIFDPTMDGAFS